MVSVKNAKPIAISSFSKSRVDIIIPFHAQYDKVTSLIKSILLSVKSNPYQITLVDDCSDNKDFHRKIHDEFKPQERSAFKPIIRCIRNEKQLGFGGSLKAGFENTNLPWVLFMHSDCLVEDPNFMLEMGRSLLNWRDQKVPVKMVSACSNNSGDCSLAKKDKKDVEGKDFILEEGSLPLFCSMCHRDLFKHIQGFIKSYPYAWYEGEELAFRMKRFGFQQGVSGKSWIRHQGAATIKYLWQKDKTGEIKKIMEQNRDLCIQDMR